jgi:hypothetical protein
MTTECITEARPRSWFDQWAQALNPETDTTPNESMLVTLRIRFAINRKFKFNLRLEGISKAFMGY